MMITFTTDLDILTGKSRPFDFSKAPPMRWSALRTEGYRFGLVNLSAKQLAKIGGISVDTIYRIFGNRANLIRAIIESASSLDLTELPNQVPADQDSTH